MQQSSTRRRGLAVALIMFTLVALTAVFLMPPATGRARAASASVAAGPDIAVGEFSNGWELVMQAPNYDSGKSFHFYNMTFVTRELGFAYGGDDWNGREAGRIYRTKDGGLTWQEVYRGGGWKIGMACADALRCWVGGKGGRVDYTTDGGDTWSKANTYTWQGMDDYPTPPAQTPVPFSAWIRSAGITADDQSVVFGATDNTILRSTDGLNFYNYWPLLAWYSATWSVDCPSDTVCYGGQIKRFVIKSTDAGANWSLPSYVGPKENDTNCLTAEYPTEGIQRRYYGLAFVNESYGWAVGSCGSLYRTINGAQGWQAQNAGLSQETLLRRVQAYNKLSAVAVGGINPNPVDPSMAQNAIIYRTTDGVTWTPVAAPDTSELHGLSGFSDATYVADWSGRIWRWDGQLAPMQPTGTPTSTPTVTETPTETPTDAPTATPTATETRGRAGKVYLPVLLR